MTDRSTAPQVAAVVFFIAASLLTLSIAFSFVMPDSQNLLVILVRLPSRFLVSSFHATSLYVPAVLLSAGLMLRSSRYRGDLLWVLLASMLPFFTAATAVRLIADARIAESPLTSSLVDVFGRAPAASLALVLFALECFVIRLLWLRRPTPITGGGRRITALLASPLARPLHAGDPAVAIEATPIPASLVDLPQPPREELSLLFTGGAFTRDQPVADPGHSGDAGDTTDSNGVAPAEPAWGPAEPAWGPAEPAWGPAEPAWVTDDVESFDDDELEAEYAEELERAWNDDEAQLSDDSHAGVVAPVDAERVDERSDDPDPLPAVPVPRGHRYDVPIAGLLVEYGDQQYWTIDQATRDAAETLRITLEEFGIQAEVTGIRKGPVITMFEILPAPGVKLSKIVNLSDNIALRLAAASVRIVAPIPGKHAVGIEIPNRERAIVGFAELLQEESFQASRMEIPIALGKDIPGDAQIVDLTRMPHVLIAGATGSGKSVCVNSIICSILYRRAPHEVKLILIDPKIVELKFYNDIPHLLTPVVTDPKRAFQALQYCIYEMERRYSLLDALQVRDIQSYNRKIVAKKLATEPIPYIVVVVDEFADLMATSGKELESTLARLAAMSRAVGIHLVLATQRPSTDVITGLIKANIPSRIAFMVASKVDSRIILDAMGADKLLGRGDMLFTSAWDPFPIRMQGAFLSEEEVERVVTYVKQLGEPDYIDDEIFVDDDEEEYVQGELEDPLMEKAIEIVTTAGKASASYLQRRLKVGYNRAARMVEEMERMGIVGPQQGSKPRDIIGVGDRY